MSWAAPLPRLGLGGRGASDHRRALDRRRVKGRSLYVDAWHRLKRNKAALAAAAILLAIVLLVIFGPMFNPWDHEIPDWDNYSTPPSLETE